MSLKSFLGWSSSDDDLKKSSTQKGPVDWKEKRRDNRIDLISGRELEVHLLIPDSSETGTTLVAQVRNISMRGCHMVFKDATDRNKASVGTTFVASLAVDGFAIPLKIQVVRGIGESEVGIQFKPPFPRELEKLERFMEPRNLGRSLREIDPAMLQKSGETRWRWFQGVNETNLFVWDDQMQLVFLNQVVEWKAGFKLRTGQIRQDASILDDQKGWVRSDILDFNSTPDPKVLDQCQALLESSLIDESVKKLFLLKLKEK